jgi:pectate lyase
MRRLRIVDVVATVAGATLVSGLGIVGATASAVSHADAASSGDDSAVVQSGDVPHEATLVGRQTLRDGDGWGSAGPGTTGGSAAESEQVHIARNRTELVAALGGDNARNANNATPKMIYVDGVINGFEDDEGVQLTCEDFADPEYDFDDYLATYDPEVWGWDEDPAGELEAARERSMRNQERRTVINVGPNTTIIGLAGATLQNLTLMLNRANNVIIRNLTFEDAIDCFPWWRPTDGQFGNWNSNYDSMSIRRSANVWIDNNSFITSPDPLPEYFGRKFEIYDGQLDITHNSDWVTVSSNVFKDHDKVMLIGSTNNPGSGDPGLLNVTLRHNLFDGVGQRAPRMRFGKIDAYNNYFKVAINAASYEFGYLWGVGVESQGYFENNYVDLRGSGVDPARIIRDWGGTAITEEGTWVQTGPGRGRPMNLLGAYNAANDPSLGDDAGWTPELRHGPVRPAAEVPSRVGKDAGAGDPAKL